MGGGGVEGRVGGGKFSLLRSLEAEAQSCPAALSDPVGCPHGDGCRRRVGDEHVPTEEERGVAGRGRASAVTINRSEKGSHKYHASSPKKKESARRARPLPFTHHHLITRRDFHTEDDAVQKQKSALLPSAAPCFPRPRHAFSIIHRHDQPWGSLPRLRGGWLWDSQPSQTSLRLSPPLQSYHFTRIL